MLPLLTFNTIVAESHDVVADVAPYALENRKDIIGGCTASIHPSANNATYPRAWLLVPALKMDESWDNKSICHMSIWGCDGCMHA
jgi:hypothetical protein